jgi:hypothetical protein
MKWARHVTHLGRDQKSVQNFGRKSLKRRYHSDDINIDGMMIIRWILGSARNGNLEVPVFFLKGEKGYAVRKSRKHKWI